MNVAMLIRFVLYGKIQLNYSASSSIEALGRSDQELHQHLFTANETDAQRSPTRCFWKPVTILPSTSGSYN